MEKLIINRVYVFYVDISELERILLAGGENLLELEKKRRGVDKDKLVFIGMADTAEYYWCSVKSLLANKSMEQAFFEAYLHDRITYSLMLGYTDRIPDDPEKLLDVGDDVKFEDVEKLLKEIEKSRNYEVSVVDPLSKKSPLLKALDPEGNEIYVWNPLVKIDEKTRKEMQRIADIFGMKIHNIDEYPPLRGEFYHEEIAEKYPTIRWNFPWKEYVVVGVPDGITDDFVYEFKTTRSKFLLTYMRPVAFAQAELYGLFFRRPSKRVQILVMENKKLHSWQKPVENGEAIKLLERFRELEHGGEAIPPKPWKCKHCKYRDVCPLINHSATA